MSSKPLAVPSHDPQPRPTPKTKPTNNSKIFSAPICIPIHQIRGCQLTRTKGGHTTSYKSAAITNHYHPGTKGGRGMRYEGATSNDQQQRSTRNTVPNPPNATNPPETNTKQQPIHNLEDILEETNDTSDEADAPTINDTTMMRVKPTATDRHCLPVPEQR